MLVAYQLSPFQKSTECQILIVSCSLNSTSFNSYINIFFFHFTVSSCNLLLSLIIRLFIWTGVIRCECWRVESRGYTLLYSLFYFGTFIDTCSKMLPGGFRLCYLLRVGPFTISSAISSLPLGGLYRWVTSRIHLTEHSSIYIKRNGIYLKSRLDLKMKLSGSSGSSSDS